jgi:hypothetical protein
MAITGKQRASRIDRRYTSIEDVSIRWKRWLGFGGLLVGLLYGSWILFGVGSQKQLSSGDLSKAHFAWNETGCEQCHASFSPIREVSFGRSSDVIALNNQKCSVCHRMPGHFESRTKPEILQGESCVACHHEHLGFHHNLLDIADRSCVRCHADLTPYAKDSNRVLAKVTSFSDHPAFRKIEQAEDPGTISFSHVQHMQPGQPKTVGDATALKWEGIQDWSNRYALKRPEGAQGLIQLKCSDCHEADYPGTSQRFYQAVQFQKHCEVCHKTPVPHGLDMVRSIEAERARVAGALLGAAGALQGAAGALQGAAGALQGAAGAAPNELGGNAEQEVIKPDVLREVLQKLQTNSTGESFSQVMERDVEGARKGLFVSLGCKKCHQLYQPTATSSPNDAWAREIVEPSKIPTQWLADASFTHGAHIQMDCKECHTLGGNAKEVMIQGVKSCRECHISDPGQRAKKGQANPHVATADCIDCHRYHHSSAVSDQIGLQP